MFDDLIQQPADALLALIKTYHADSRPQKLDLGVGVFRDDAGRTPVMRAVKAAEQILVDQQDSKRYVGTEGDLEFVDHMKAVAFGSEAGLSDRISGLQTPGGGGALRLGAELIHVAKADATVWISAPTWPNHLPTMKSARLNVATYDFADLTKQVLVFDRLVNSLSLAKKGDIVLLHGCCHNPTGLDLSIEEWHEIAKLIVSKGLIPFVDLAYQGLGKGLEEDASGTRIVLDAVDEALVAYSCDKNFGLYRERVGALYLVGKTRSSTEKATSHAATLARVNWSMPPDHGAAVVRTILADAELTSIWKSELEGMCRRINRVREALADAHPSLEFIKRQQGLFSTLDMSADQAAALRSNHGVYLPNSGRINIAGLSKSDAPELVKALLAEGCLSSEANCNA